MVKANPDNVRPTGEETRRRARRAFIRTHHPDAGGDHAGFVSGLAELDRQPRAQEHGEPAAERPTEPAAEDVQPWPVSLTTTVLRRAWRRERRP